jgi:hypothetical protein
MDVRPVPRLPRLTSNRHGPVRTMRTINGVSRRSVFGMCITQTAEDRGPRSLKLENAVRVCRTRL